MCAQSTLLLRFLRHGLSDFDVVYHFRLSCFFVHKTSQKMVFLPPPKPPPLRPPVFPDGVRKNNKSKSSKRKRSAEGEDGEKNTGANRNRVPNPENPIGANELIREEKKEVILDEETIRWRNERKKNYPRSSTDKTNGKKTEEEEAAMKRKREEELESVLEEQRRLGSFEATVLLKEEEKDFGTNNKIKNKNKSDNKKRSEQPCKFWTRNGKCRYGEKCLFLHDEAKRGIGKKNKTDTNNAKRQKRRGGGGGGEVPLLRRIFKNDIDRDNSRLLQSIRFFVENIDELRKYATAQERSEELNREYLKRLKMFSFVDDPVKRTQNSIVKKKAIEEEGVEVSSSDEEEEEEEKEEEKEEAKENKQDVGGFFSLTCYDSDK